MTLTVICIEKIYVKNQYLRKFFKEIDNERFFFKFFFFLGGGSENDSGVNPDVFFLKHFKKSNVISMMPFKIDFRFVLV